MESIGLATPGDLSWGQRGSSVRPCTVHGSLIVLVAVRLG